MEFRSQSTRNTYKYALKKFFDFKQTTPENYFVEGKKLQDYKHDLIIFARFLEDSLKMTPKSITTYLGGAVSFFIRNDIEMPRRFWKELQVGSYAVTNDGIITTEILRKIFSHADTCGRAMFLLGATSGMRIEDTLAVTVAQVKEGMKNNPAKMSIIQLKTRQKQPVFFSQETAEAIREWLKARNTYLTTGVNHCIRGKYVKKSLDDPRLFPFAYNRALHLWNQAITTAGFNQKDEVTKRNIYHIHGLRKFFRSQCTVAGVEPNIAEMFLGHINGLSQYHQYTPEFIAQQYRMFEESSRIFIEVIENQETVTKIEAMERIIRNQEERLRRFELAMKEEIIRDVAQHPESKKVWGDLAH